MNSNISNLLPPRIDDRPDDPESSTLEKEEREKKKKTNSPPLTNPNPLLVS
jgi:hypothetical protein